MFRYFPISFNSRYEKSRFDTMNKKDTSFVSSVFLLLTFDMFWVGCVLNYITHSSEKTGHKKLILKVKFIGVSTLRLQQVSVALVIQ